MNIFIVQNDVVQIPLCICSSISQQSIMYIGETKESLLKENNTDYNIEKAEEHIVWFRYPNYADSNKIMEDNVHSDKGELKVNITNIRWMKLSLLLKDWTFQDAQGNKIPPTAANLHKLNPIIGNYLGIKLDQII